MIQAKVVMLAQSKISNRLGQICKLDHYKGYYCELKGNIVIALEVPVPQTITATHKCSDGKEYWNGFLTPQHLYFTTDEPIVRGDWYMYDEQPRVIQQCIISPVGVGAIKIVAATDKTLPLPGLPQSFLQTYVESNGSIETVYLLTE